MGYGYDLEAAKTKIPPAIDEAETFLNSRVPQVKEALQDIAKTVNADKLTKLVQTACDAIDAQAAIFKQMLGSDGDSVTTGSLYGALASAKKMDEAMNG